jgi:serine/threonine-protein kinase
MTPSVDKSAPPLDTGVLVGQRYELLLQAARGGMATVWAARLRTDFGFEKLVAVKTILPAFASELGFRSMFLDEARIAARIRHPNVSSIDEFGEENGTLFMALEWVHGESWTRLFNAIAAAGDEIPVPEFLRIAADALSGLHAAHELVGDDGELLNVVHRDVSPHNILISTAGVTKVIDFGIAKAVDRIAETTVRGNVKGKPWYVAPEQFGEDVDRRVDVWAMGVVLYQMFSGNYPVRGLAELALLRLSGSGWRPEPLPEEVPSAVAQVIYRALSVNPDERYQSALDMQRAIEAVMPRPVSTVEVAALVRHYLSERLEERRCQLTEALAQANARGRGPRTSLASYPELAPASRYPSSFPGPDRVTPVTRRATPAEPGAVASAVQPTDVRAMASARRERKSSKPPPGVKVWLQDPRDAVPDGDEEVLTRPMQRTAVMPGDWTYAPGKRSQILNQAAWALLPVIFVLAAWIAY